MFNYTHEVIINSLAGTLKGENVTLYPSGATSSKLAVYDDPALTGVKHLLIERAGDYRGDLVFPRTQGLVFKTLPIDGQFSTLTLTVGTVKAGDVISVSIFAKLLDPAAIAEYAYPNWASFGKPILVNITAKSATAADVAQQLADALKEAIPYNNKFITVEVSGAVVTLTASEYGLELDAENGCKIEHLVEGECDPCALDAYEPYSGVTAKSTKTVVPFGTGEKLVENYRFPTYGNVRYAALNSDEAPIPGAKYIMYSFAYDSPRPGFGGMSGVGQKVDAVTRHIFWVKEDLKDAFDNAIKAAIGNSAIVEKKTVGSTVEDPSSNGE